MKDSGRNSLNKIVRQVRTGLPAIRSRSLERRLFVDLTRIEGRR
jgi:hypothetical protein